MTTCPNLKTIFGDKYKVWTEESAENRNDPWGYFIPCLKGTICPWGENLLAACTNGRGPKVRQLMYVPSAKLVQDGDDGVNVTFHICDIKPVFEIMGPRTRPQLTDEQRAKLIENLGNRRLNAPSDSQDNDQGIAPMASMDNQATGDDEGCLSTK